LSGSSLSVYEAWVRTLRAWRRDPLTDLTQLPALDETSFPPATYQRLVSHLNDAINEFMRRWQGQLAAALGAAGDDHARARALVDARVGLGYRLQLARHPAFPEEIRKQLLAQAETDIRGLQAQLEDDAQHVVAASSGATRQQREATLKLFRTNALVAVLDPSFTVDGSFDDREIRRAEATAALSVTPDPPRAATGLVPEHRPRRPTRQIFISEAEEE